LVLFEVTDQCRASSRAYLLIRILQPPQPYSDSAWVNRGATERTSLYVHDPDSFSHDFTFSPPLGIAVQVGGQHEPRDKDGAWGGLLYEVEISVNRALRDPVYGHRPRWELGPRDPLRPRFRQPATPSEGRAFRGGHGHPLSGPRSGFPWGRTG